MNLNEAFENASRILEEEQVQPTLGYRYVSEAWPTNNPYSYMQYDLKNKGWTVPMVAQAGLNEERKKRPRQVYEDPRLWVFQSTNFSLMLKIMSQVAEPDRASFIARLLN